MSSGWYSVATLTFLPACRPYSPMIIKEKYVVLEKCKEHIEEPSFAAVDIFTSLRKQAGSESGRGSLSTHRKCDGPIKEIEFLVS